jgi:hypothetical protein
MSADPAVIGQPEVATPKKKETVYTPVVMSDGTTVQFAGDTKASKTLLQDAKGKFIGVRWDFRNGQTRTILLEQVLPQFERLAVHGLSQKGGDSYASEKDVEDAVVAFDDTADTLLKGEWSEQREGGFGGISVLMKACMEHFKQSQEAVKAVLKTMTPKEKIQLRQADGIREIVQRLESEKAKASSSDIAKAVAKFQAAA